jgi:hypothetical protein
MTTITTPSRRRFFYFQATIGHFIGHHPADQTAGGLKTPPVCPVFGRSWRPDKEPDISRSGPDSRPDNFTLRTGQLTGQLPRHNRTTRPDKKPDNFRTKSPTSQLVLPLKPVSPSKPRSTR